MGLCVARSVVNDLRAEAASAGPEECCGLLLGRAGLIDEIRLTANVAQDRRRRFEIDPQALIDAHRLERGGGRKLIGYFHSHPAGSAEPSATDRAMANRDGRVWAIVAKNDVTFWRDEEGGFVPLSYTIEDR